MKPREKNRNILLLFTAALICAILSASVLATDDYSDLVISNVDETRSRIVMVDGNMYFHAGKSKNITFRVGDGASIWFDKTDILSLPNTTQIDELNQQVSRFSARVTEISFHLVNTNEKSLNIEKAVRGLGYELVVLRKNFTDFAKKKKDKANSRLRSSINQLALHISNFTKLISRNECINQPCNNGGTCIDLVGKFQCLCPAHFNGPRCDNRIDECALYASSHIGCQHNATCSNNGILPGIKCHCPKGFYGTHCHMRSTSCDLNLDLCGEHGHCLPSPSTDIDSMDREGYKCLCEFGYVSDNDPDNPTCVDIDECATAPCYPGAGCVNTPGGFRCTSCPAGMQGNGIQCADFDECADENTHECSKFPKVQCLNTFGGYTCGPCPKGYTGDGKKCVVAESPCKSVQCSKHANCTDIGALKAACTCEEGYTGDGIGRYGCTQTGEGGSAYCDLRYCNFHGECSRDSNYERVCTCSKGFSGTYCEHSDVCVGKICNFRGTCKPGVDVDTMHTDVLLRYPVCDCDEGYYGDDCEREEIDCGFHTHNDTGVIELYENGTTKTKTCQFTIQLHDARKIIQFHFENYTADVMFSHFLKGCNTNFGNISIYDGSSTASPRIGTFCSGDFSAPSFNEPFYTSGNSAKLLVSLSSLTFNNHVRLVWNATTPRCGGRLTGSTGTLSYADIHDEDLCVWYISVPAQYHLELNVKSVTMGTGAEVNCDINSLEIFDHQSAVASSRILELCESIKKGRIIRTTVPYATVYFKTDRKLVDSNLGAVNCDDDEPSSWCGVGFSITYRVIELDTGCGGDIRPDASGQMSGYITSPHYPHPYFPNMNCFWRLNAAIENETEFSVAQSARKVRIEFVDFDIPTSTRDLVIMGRRTNRLETCLNDNVRLMPKGGIFCNLRPPSGVYSFPHFELGFTSDQSGNGRGFKLRYESICELDYTEKNGTIQSPNYPQPSKEPFKCTYRIIGTQREAIRIIFRDIGLKTSVSTCFYNKAAQAASEDYIEFSGGHASSEQINRRYVCARYPFVAPIGQIVTSANVPFSITYSSSGSTDNAGFLFDYEIYDVGCGGFFFTQTGTLTSPSYPERYPSFMHCIYEIVSGTGNQIRLDFDVFDVENVANNEGCGFDHVSVYDTFYTNDDSHGELLGRFCGMSLPPSLLSISNKLAVVFMSDRSVNGIGFSAKYRVVKADTDCDRTFTTENGIIEYNGTLYPRNTKCDYIIALPKMHRITLSFENVTMPCESGSITVKNGMTATSPEIPGFQSFCDSTHSVKLITQGNRAFIRVVTTAPSKTFFRLRYEIFANGCGGRVSGISGYFSAPQYPDKDSRSLDCTWSVTVAEGNRVKLTFPFIDDLSSATARGECTTFAANHLDVIDGNNENNLLRRYCVKETSSSAIISEGNQLLVHYVQHGGSYQGSLFGFLGHFVTECENIVLTAHHGSIQSPGFGTSDATVLKCKYTIRTSPGSRIRLIFHQLNIDSCLSSYLIIPKSQIANVTFASHSDAYADFRLNDFYTFCSNYIPTEIVSVSNFLEISYKSNFQVNNFWVSYSTIGCGGIIYTNNTEVAVRSDDFTANATARECAYVIRAPIGYVIRFAIDYAYFMGNPEDGSKCDDIENPSNADSDGIAFYAGTSNRSGIAQKVFCHTLRNEVYVSHTNELYVRMRLSPKNIQHSQDGLIMLSKVTFEKFVMGDATCGGIIEVNSTKRITITSPGYPKPYEHGIRCLWEFRAAEGTLLQFNLKEFTNPSADKRNVLVYPIDDTITNCSMSMSYLEGGLTFYRGAYNQSEKYTWNRNMVFRICNGISAPYPIDPSGDRAVVVFQGSSQSKVVTSGGDDEIHGGFVLEAWATCGGQLTAERRPKTFLVDHNGGSDNINRCKYVFTRDTDNEDEGDTLFVRGEYLSKASKLSVINKINFTCGTVEEESFFSDSHIISANRDWGTCNDKLELETTIAKDAGRFLITYGLENTFCGGLFNGDRRKIVYDLFEKEIDCEWNFLAPGGDVILVNIDFPNLPESDLCQESYVEIRLSNETTARPRFCGAITNGIRYIAPNVTVRLRYRPDNSVPDALMSPGFLKMESGSIPMSQPTEGMLEPHDRKFIKWDLVPRENESYVKLVFEEYNIPPYSGIELHISADCTDCRYEIEGFLSSNEPPKIYWIPSNNVHFYYSTNNTLFIRPFKARWEGVSIAEFNKRTSKKIETLEDFNCGENLTASYEPQTLKNPVTSYGYYENNLRCLWTITNPSVFTSLQLRIKKLDFEYSQKCTYDYLRIDRNVGLRDGDVGTIGEYKYCHAVKGEPFDLYSYVGAGIEMYTDRSRGASGFELDYWLNCNNNVIVGMSESPYEAVLTNPGYPEPLRKNISCSWSVMLASRRALNVSVEMDLDGIDKQCNGDYLNFTLSLFSSSTKNRCGKKNFNFVSPSGRVFINFNSDNNVHKNKFKITMKEIINDCSSSNLKVDEHTPIRTLSSPGYPKLSEDSLDCKYVMSAPTGHRIKFTVDLMTFSLENSNPEKCEDDFIEIRDGSSEASPLIGRYCGNEAPSTIFSTASSLFVRYTTDSYVMSPGFNATYELASCGGSIVIPVGHNATVTSPNYPRPYPRQSECGWTVKAPVGHFINAKINRLNLKFSDNCTTEHLALRDYNATGDYIAGPSCNKLGSIEKTYQSIQNSMFVEFSANSTTDSFMSQMYCPGSVCGFELEVSSTSYECGGLITDDAGTITLPQYPNPITSIYCQWNFNAGIGFNYVLNFKFDDDADGFYVERNGRCYPNIVFTEGIPLEYTFSSSSPRHFCANSTNFVTTSDLLRLAYKPFSAHNKDKIINGTTINVPWSIEYKKVPVTKTYSYCNRKISKNFDWRYNSSLLHADKSFCHLQLNRPFDGTTVIKFTNISNREDYISTSCDHSNYIELKSIDSSSWPIEQIICNVTGHTNETIFVYPNTAIDLLAYSRVIPFDDLYFDISVRFYPCGGTIKTDEAQSGIITSPNFGDGNVYNKNMDCLWYLHAPEGHVVELAFDFIDIEHHVECKNDYLIVAEGDSLHSVIHRYCDRSDSPTPDRFKNVRSRSRELTLQWHADSNVQRKGFNLTYSFVPYHKDGDKSCGFASHASSGLITTPNWPKDYPHEISCIWDISVPYGYHVKLDFDDFDVQLSRNCDKDYLLLSQEYQSRALAPLGDYYFYFEHEEKQPTMCGNELPKPFIAESNRIRLNFTTDASIAGRGFKARWSTQCGSVMALTHGVITSPHYPLYYPNENFVCEYLIYPKLPDGSVPIVTLKILDINLAEYNIFGHDVNHNVDCVSDYLEIIDVASNNKSLMKLCGRNLGNQTELPPISVNGGIGVRFVANSSKFESDKNKGNRGFKLSYALADCGGEIRLDDTSERLSSFISSPGYPLPYHRNLDCVWNVTAPKGRIISAKFVAIDLEYTDSRCLYDFIEMYNGHVTNFTKVFSENSSTTANGLIGRYCGSQAPANFLVTEGRNMTVRFRSDHSKSMGGFKLVVTATLGPEAGCGGGFAAKSDWSTLIPPLDSKGKYFNGMRCLWNIKAVNDKEIIEFRVDQLNVESRRRIEGNASSCYDFIAIYDGPRATSNFLLTPTCTLPKLPTEYQSSYRYADFYFESDVADGFDGFSVSYRSIKPLCGGYLKARDVSQRINYESEQGLLRTHLHNQRCRWFIYSKEKQPIMLDFTEFNFPSTDTTCPFEFLEIRDVGVPEECEHPACADASVSKDVLRYCGNAKPAKFVARSSIVQITTSILTTSQYVGKFALEYAVYDNCNRTIAIPNADSHLASGRLTSPNYPNPYDNNSTCSTVLSAPSDYRFLLVFSDFNIENGFSPNGVFFRLRDRTKFLNSMRSLMQPSCLYDNVTITLGSRELLESQNSSSSLSMTLCSKMLPPAYFSKDHSMSIDLKSDTSMTGKGYDASYYMVRPAKLGDHVFYDFHTIYDKSGVLASLGFPMYFEANSIQRWKIAPPAGLECNFIITQLKLAPEDGIGECNHTLRHAVMKANDLSPTIPWNLLPCKESALPEAIIPKTKGMVHYFEVRFGDKVRFDVRQGIRVTWTCDSFSEDVI